MKKNFIKIGVIGMALVFSLGVSFNAMAMESAAAVTPTPQVKTAVTSKVVKDKKPVLTVVEKDAVKVAAIQADKDTLIKLEKDDTITKAQAEKLALKTGHKGHGFALGHHKNGHHKNSHHKNGHNKMMNKNGFEHKDFKEMNSGNKVNCDKK